MTTMITVTFEVDDYDEEEFHEDLCRAIHEGDVDCLDRLGVFVENIQLGLPED